MAACKKVGKVAETWKKARATLVMGTSGRARSFMFLSREKLRTTLSAVCWEPRFAMFMEGAPEAAMFGPLPGRLQIKCGALGRGNSHSTDSGEHHCHGRPSRCGCWFEAKLASRGGVCHEAACYSMLERGEGSPPTWPAATCASKKFTAHVAGPR